MQYTTKCSIVQLARVRVHVLVVLSVLALAVVSDMPDTQAGWITCPPQVVMVAPASQRRQGEHLGYGGIHHGAACWSYLSRTWYIPVLRSLLLWSLWPLSGQQGPAWVSLVPWLQWLWQLGGVLWPWLRRQPEWRAGR